jgi:predicted O-methyltransferase YrrM
LIEQVQNGQVEFHIGNDLQVLTEFPDGYFDWVYLDSTHEYSQTKQELALLQTKVKPAGLITGDDWQDDPRHIHHGVSKAVNEFLEDNPSWKIVFREHTQWALREEPS